MNGGENGIASLASRATAARAHGSAEPTGADRPAGTNGTGAGAARRSTDEVAERAPDASPDARTTFVTAGPHRWRVRRAGMGPVCLLLHGTGASLHSWAGIEPLLAAHHEVVSIDLPGHARTRSAPDASLSLASTARDVATLLDVLAVEPALVVGHSSGAAVLAELALGGRVDGARLVGIAPAMLLLDGPAGTLFPSFAKVAASLSWLPRVFAWRSRDPRAVRRLLDGTGSRVDDAMVAAYAELLADSGHVAGVLRMMAEWDLARLDARLDRLDAPFRLLAGADDRTVPLRIAYRIAARLPNATLDVLDGLGHLAHEEDPARVASLLLAPAPTPPGRTPP